MPETNNTPNMELGKVIVEILVSEGLILPEKRASILQKLCDGTMTSNEWKSSTEMKILKGGGILDNAKSDQEN